MHVQIYNSDIDASTTTTDFFAFPLVLTDSRVTNGFFVHSFVLAAPPCE